MSSKQSRNFVGVAVVLLGAALIFWLYNPTEINDQSTTQQARPAHVEDGNVPAVPDDIEAHVESKSDMIVVDSPEPMAVISSPLTVRGEARGTWFFEAVFPIVLVDWDGRIIAESYASAVLDANDPDSTWMTEEFVPFEGTIEFMMPEDVGEFSKRGTIIFQKDNPSGLPEQDDAIEIPIQFWQ